LSRILRWMPPSWRVIASTLAFVSLLSTPARAQQDPWSARVRALSDTSLAAFQGVDCVSIHAPRSIVWRLLVAPEYAAAWFFADSPKLKPRGAHYKKGPTVRVQWELPGAMARRERSHASGCSLDWKPDDGERTGSSLSSRIE
jgi:hypothetical protein